MRAAPWELLLATGAPALSKPTRTDLEVVWAMIARGHATAMPSSVINPRRRIELPHANVRAYPALVNVALSDGESSGFRGERPVAIVGDPITRQAAGNSTDSASASWPSPVSLGSACAARSLPRRSGR